MRYLFGKLWFSFRDGLWRARRSPRLSIAVVLCIALGMAATASVATLVSLTSLQSLPFPDSERLVRIWNFEDSHDRRLGLTWLDFSDLRDGMDTLDALEAAARSRLVWHLPARGSRRVQGEAVSDGYFGLLDVSPYMGRLFSQSEMEAGEPVMLLGYHTWAREFNYAEDILGTAIRTSTQDGDQSRSYTVIGVLPPDFYGTIENDIPELEFWVPARAYYDSRAWQARDSGRSIWAVGRLAPGSSLASAQAEADGIAAALAPEFAVFSDSHEFHLESMGANWREGFRDAGVLLAAVAALLLAVAVLNVAMLLVARTMERRHELSVRAALGAGRWQLVAPVLGETLLLATVGGAVGLAVAGPLLTGFLSISDTQIPNYLEVRPDSATLAITFALMLLAGGAAAVLPAWAATRVDVNDALREGSGKLSGSRSASRWGRWLVGGQVAMTLALLLAGALLGRSYWALAHDDLGFATDRVKMTLFISPMDEPDDAALPAFVDRVKNELRTQPGVRDVALMWPTLPMPYAVPGRLQWGDMPESERDPGVQVSYYVVHEGFFDALEVPLLAGREFDARDAEPGRRTAVIGRNLAERLGGPAAALDREVTHDGTDYRVVGVVGEMKIGGPRETRALRHKLYLPYAQAPRRVVTHLVHVAGDPKASVEPLRQTLARVAPNSAMDWVGTVDEYVGHRYRETAFRLVLVAAFAVSALLLAAVGLYAVLAQQVSATTTEIGIRKALGASDSRIMGRVVRRGLAVTMAGVAAGLVLSLAFSRVLAGLLHGIGALDPVAYAVAAGTVILIATLACLLPARRAARIAPMEALRYE